LIDDDKRIIFQGNGNRNGPCVQRRTPRRSQ
jgi:hypothetical protein